MDVSRDFFGKLRALALTLEKEVRQLERALRREDTGKHRPCLVSFPGRPSPPVPLPFLGPQPCSGAPAGVSVPPPGSKTPSPEGDLEGCSRWLVVMGVTPGRWGWRLCWDSPGGGRGPLFIGSPRFGFPPAAVPLCSSRHAEMGLRWADGLGSSSAGYDLGSPSYHCLSELLCECVGELLLRGKTGWTGNHILAFTLLMDWDRKMYLQGLFSLHR